jgi:hypothetical protein
MRVPDNGLNIHDVLRAITSADIEIEIVLNRHVNQAGDGILCFLA